MGNKKWHLDPIFISVLVILQITLFGCSILQNLSIVPPDTPTGLAVGTPTANGLNISWNSSIGATSYQLSRSTSANGPWTQVYNNSTTSYVDSGLSGNTTYYYEVKATNSAGSSLSSAPVSGTTTGGGGGGGGTIAVPSGLIVGTATTSSLNVSWSAVTGSGTVSYQVYRDTSSSVTTSSFKAYDGTGTSFTDSLLAAGATYYYAVRATDTSGSSAVSTSQFASTTALSGTVSGYDAFGAGGDSTLAANTLLGQQLTAGTTGTLQGFGITSWSDGPKVKMALYSDNGSNAPGVLLAYSSATIMTKNGSDRFDVEMVPNTGAAIVSGTKYWVMVVFDSSGNFGAGGTAPLQITESMNFASSYASTFSGGTAGGYQKVGFYIKVQ
jgi:hypothetical protein